MFSFSFPDGNWSEALYINEHLGNQIISVQGFSSDGKYLFLNGKEDGIYNFYWINTKFIERLKLETLDG